MAGDASAHLLWQAARLTLREGAAPFRSLGRISIRPRAPVAIPDFLYAPNVCVFCDGVVHDEPAQAALDRHVRDTLVALGYRVIVVRYDRPVAERIESHADVFGGRPD